MIPEIWEEKWDRHVSTHTAPIWQDITDDEGNLLLDDIYRLESLNEEMPRLCETLGIPAVSVKKANSSNISNYRRHYTSRTLRRIEDLYGEDIAKLNYRPY